MITRKTCILQWEHVVENLEQIVEGRKKMLALVDTAFGRAWLRGFEIGLEHAQQNLEKARSEPFFIVFFSSIPTGETQTQLLYSFMDVIVEEIEEYRAEQVRLEMLEEATNQAPVLVESPSYSVMEEPQAVEQYSMMDGVKHWFVGHRWADRGMKVLEISKFWRTV